MNPDVLKHSEIVPFTELIDLANEKVGGKVLWSSDDFFAEKENLLKASQPIFIPDKFTENGKWMDGWESRRKRVAGHDIAIIKLGLPGNIEGLNIDTSFFVGNYPEYASMEFTDMPLNSSVDELNKANWKELLVKTPLKGGSSNYISVGSKERATHLRFHIYPDGGVARLRVHGFVKPDLSKVKGQLDLAAAEYGGRVITCNDSFFGPKDNLIYPGRAKTMGEGWETRRKRGPQTADWIIVKLCGTGAIQKVEIDTNHFKGNFPDRFSLEGCLLKQDMQACDFRDQKVEWIPILPETKLEAHKQQNFEIKNLNQNFNYVRLNIFPDGGISRLRVFGELTK